MADSGNGDWDENRKLVLQTLIGLQVQIRDVAHEADASSTARHKAVVTKLTQLEKRMDKREVMLEDKYVSKIEFHPISRAVYGMVGIALSGVVIAILALIINKGIL